MSKVEKLFYNHSHLNIFDQISNGIMVYRGWSCSHPQHFLFDVQGDFFKQFFINIRKILCAILLKFSVCKQLDEVSFGHVTDDSRLVFVTKYIAQQIFDFFFLNKLKINIFLSHNFFLVSYYVFEEQLNHVHQKGSKIESYFLDKVPLFFDKVPEGEILMVKTGNPVQ